MKREFDVPTLDFGRVLLICLGVALMAAAALRGVFLLQKDHQSLATGLLLAAFGAGMWVMVRLPKTLGTGLTRVTLTDHSLTLLNHRTGREQHLPFREMTSYSYFTVKSIQRLVLTRHNGSRLVLAIDTETHDNYRLQELVDEFEAALALHRQRYGTEGSPVREASIF